jgi:hypothetical protein
MKARTACHMEKEECGSCWLGYPKLLVRVIDVTCIAVQGCGTFQSHHGMRLRDGYASFT